MQGLSTEHDKQHQQPRQRSHPFSTLLSNPTSTLTSHGISPLPGTATAPTTTSPASTPLNSINLRDLGVVTGGIVSTGIVYRSSQVVAPEQLKALGITTVVDLRQAPVACKTHSHNMRQSFKRILLSICLWIRRNSTERVSHLSSSANKKKKNKGLETSPRMESSDLDHLLADVSSPHDHYNSSTTKSGKETEEKKCIGVDAGMNKQAAPCWRCTEAGEAVYGVRAQVYHVDLLPGIVSLFIFIALPHRLQLKVIYLALRRRHPEPVVAAAVADPRVLGYFKLYKIILSRAKGHIASALRLLLGDEHVPMLIHCIHGKDRTGLVVMLIYLLCGVPDELIIRDYALSESLLREGRESRQLLGIEEQFTTDEIMAATAHVMEDTLGFLREKYGDVETYLKSAGMTGAEIDGIRARLLVGRGAGVVDGVGGVDLEKGGVVYHS